MRKQETANAVVEKDGNGVSPHEFKRLGRVLHRSKCRACYLPPERHPTTSYAPARPLGDKRGVVFVRDGSEEHARPAARAEEGQ